MKARILNVVLLCGVNLVLFSCNKKSTHKPVNYIFLCDTINDRQLAMFHSLLYDPWITDGDALSEAPPVGYRDITITAFDLSSGDDPKAVVAFFPQDNDDDKARAQIADDFISELKPVKASQTVGKNLLHALSSAVNEINDAGTDYRIIICSKMIENSGGPILDPKQNANWKAGHFHFVNTENNCLTQELNSARLQVDSSKDWIYNNLVDLHDSNPDYYHCRVYVTLYQEPANLISTPEYPYDKNDIYRFWTALFSKMQLKVRNGGTTPSIQSILLR